MGVLFIDHVAVTTSNFVETAQHYLSLPNARILRGPGWNSSQNVKYLFVSFGSDLCIEILGIPDTGESPIKAHLSTGGGAYHVCHAVKDLDYAIKIAEEHGAKVIMHPKSDDAYDGREIAFLVHADHGLFELVEASASFSNVDVASSLEHAQIDEKLSLQKNDLSSEDNVSQKVRAAFENVFKDTLPENQLEWTSSKLETWDSLSHLRLIMEIEKTLDLTLPSNELHNLQSFNSIISFLKR